MIAGTFLFLSYFGTDQSQVGRYLGGTSITESRLGLLFNGLLKIPMQFIILFIGVLVYLFFLFHQPPVFHNEVLLNQARQQGTRQDVFQQLESQYNDTYEMTRLAANGLV